MRVQIINPNTNAAITKKIWQASMSVAHAGTEVIAKNVAHGPDTIECAVDEVLASTGVLELVLQGESEGVDAHIIACFGDPAIDAARELAQAPVIGIAGAAFQMASLISHKFAVVTTRKRTIAFAESLLSRYGFDHQCSGVYASDLAVADCELFPDAAFKMVYQDALLALKEGAEVIVLGCAGMSDWADKLSMMLSVPVIDGVKAAILLAESLHQLNLKTAKIGQYGQPFPKSFTGRYQHFSKVV